MIDIYKYKDVDRIKLTDIDDKIWIGNIEGINDVEDEDEELGLKEDSVTLWIDGKPVTFGISEIKKIEVI